jgi:hypothetical protein
LDTIFIVSGTRKTQVKQQENFKWKMLTQELSYVSAHVQVCKCKSV